MPAGTDISKADSYADVMPAAAAETPDVQQVLQGEQATAAGTPVGTPVERPAPDVKMESDDEVGMLHCKLHTLRLPELPLRCQA